MAGSLFALATAAYVVAAATYYAGRLRAAAALGVGFFALLAVPARAALGPLAGTLALVALGVAPLLYLAVHALDARRGLFLLPTIYSIPLAFLAGLALWAITGLALLF